MGLFIPRIQDLEVDEVIIQAIKRSRIRTGVMIRQIETCLEILRIGQIEKQQPEKYEVIYCLYMDKAKKEY